VLNNLSYDLTEHAKQPDEALKYAQKAKELAPGDGRVAHTLGWVLYQKGLYSAAVTQLESAVSARNLAPGDDLGRLQYHLAMACFRSGNRERGKQALEAAAQIAPALPEARLAREMAARDVAP
jgi:Tfp pilus assembly protein PilF